MTLGRIVVDLLAKTGSFETDLNRAGKLAEKRAREIDRQFKAAGKAIGLALAAGATAAAVAIKSSIDRMDELSKAAQRAQMPTEEFSRLAYAGSLADVAMEDLQKSMGKLAKAQGDAAQGLTTQVRGFEALGIAFKNADGSLRPTYDVFLDFADAFQKHKGSPEVIALGMQVFGRSFQNLIPLLKDGRAGLQAMADESDRLGATISTEAGAAAEEFNDNLTRLQTAAMGLANEVAANLMPDLLELSGAFVGAANDGNTLKETAGEITDFLHVLANAAHVVSSAFEIMGTSMASSAVLARSLMQLLSGDRQGSADSVREAYQMIGDEWREAFAADKPKRDPRFARVSGSARGSWEDVPGLVIPDATARKSGGASAEKAAREATRLRDEILKSGEDITRSMMDREDAQLDLTRAELDHQAAVARTIDDMQFQHSLYGMSILDQEKAIALRYAGVDAMSAEGRAITDLVEKMEEASEARRFVDDIRGAVTDFAADALSGFGSIGDAFEEMADRMKRAAANLLAEKAIEWLFNAFFGGGSNLPGQDQSSGGGWWSSLFGGGRANGGPVSGSKLYEVGEGGSPELFAQNGRTYLIPGSSGTVIPASSMGGGMGGGGMKVVINNNNGSQVSAEEKTDGNGMAFLEIAVDKMVGKSLDRGTGAKVLQHSYGLRRAGMARGV